MVQGRTLTSQECFDQGSVWGAENLEATGGYALDFPFKRIQYSLFSAKFSHHPQAHGLFA